MSRNKPYLALTVAGLVALTVVVLFISIFSLVPSNASATGDGDAPLQVADPMALIKNMLIGGQDKTEASLNEVKITRADGTEEPAKADSKLYLGDEVTTGPSAQITILFLDNVPEKDNEVLVSSNSRVRIGSLFTWLGKVLIRCRGAFETRTEKVRLGVQGTEFEVIVEPDGTNRVTILEGEVSVENLTTTSIESRPMRDWLAQGLTGAEPRLINASFVQRPSPQERLDLVAVSGETSTVENNFTFVNRCRVRHLYQIYGPRNLDWFQILGADRFEIAARQSRVITFAIRMDARRVPPGTYEGEIVARCLDCGTDTSCDLAGSMLATTVKVISRTGGSGTTGGRTVSAKRLQEVVVDNNGMRPPAVASQAKLEAAVNWSNRVILTGQPTYPAQSVIPHFPSWEIRDERFRIARREALLRNDPKAYEVLGDVYTDWGSGAKAVDSYRRAGRPESETSADFYTDVAEALRLSGRLDEADANVKRALAINPQSALALNAAGNLFRDRAKIAFDAKDYERTEFYLGKARDQYNLALKVAPPTTHHAQTDRPPRSVTAVSWANMGRVFFEFGELSRARGDTDVALRSYQTAERAFRTSSDTDQTYAFARTGLGDVYRGSALALSVRGERARSDQFFGRALEEYRNGLRLHRDMAEAFVGLGDVSIATGRKDDAITNYTRAAQLRPEKPEPHYRLAVSLADSNPKLAAEHAATFLKVEPKVFLQGERARIAERVRRELPIESTQTPTPTPSPGITPTPTPTPSPRVTPTPTPTPIPGTGEPLIKVPGLRGDKPESALNELRKRGFLAQQEPEPDCDASGKVVRSEPEKDARVPRGTMVTIFVSSTGDDPATVPRVTGQSVRDAERELRDASLSMKIGRKEETDRVAPDTVMRQKPDAFRKLKKNCPVELTIAVPIPPVKVGNFIGMTLNSAQSAITFSGLSTGQISEVDSDNPEGTVIEQSPGPGEIVPRGTRVNLVVVRVTTTVVPNVVGRTMAQAKAMLANRGLVYEFMGGEADKVSSQDPVGGTRVAKGTVVRLWFNFDQN